MVVWDKSVHTTHYTLHTRGVELFYDTNKTSGVRQGITPCVENSPTPCPYLGPKQTPHYYYYYYYYYYYSPSSPSPPPPLPSPPPLSPSPLSRCDDLWLYVWI